MKNKFLAILPEEIEKIDLQLEDNFPNFILLYFFYKNGELMLNNQKPYEFSDSNNSETIIRNPNGKYKVIIYSIKNEKIESIIFNPSLRYDYEILAIPPYLNIGRIEFLNLDNNKKDEIELLGLSICNENNVCEKGEENLCPLDCSQSQNKNYPLFPFLNNIKELTIQESYNYNISTPTNFSNLPQNYFYQIIIFSLIIFGIFILLGVIFIKKFKK
ncbi:MAG: hypothetical protein NZ866_00750 [Patescibacteria group bacterium]|nr:hypothetical protein [Patescibacteria group bacterium]